MEKEDEKSLMITILIYITYDDTNPIPFKIKSGLDRWEIIREINKADKDWLCYGKS